MGIEREDAATGSQLRHANQAGIRKRYGQVFVLVNEFPQCFALGQNRKVDLEEVG